MEISPKMLTKKKEFRPINGVFWAIFKLNTVIKFFYEECVLLKKDTEIIRRLDHFLEDWMCSHLIRVFAGDSLTICLQTGRPARTLI